METRMRKTAFILLGALLISGSAVQVATAAQHHTRSDRSHPRWDRTYNQLREPSSATSQTGYDYGKPPANESRTCDIKWCYSD
jgi:hypothetical protein